jgi:hypothetical protein
MKSPAAIRWMAANVAKLAGVAIEDTQRIGSMKKMCGLSQFVYQFLNINPSVARTTGRQLAVDHDCGNGSDA